MSDPKGYGIDFVIIRNDPAYVPGYISIRLKGSGVEVVSIYREWKRGIFKREYHWVVKTVFKNLVRGNIIGGYYSTQDEAIENAVRITKEIFRRPETSNDPEI